MPKHVMFIFNEVEFMMNPTIFSDGTPTPMGLINPPSLIPRATPGFLTTSWRIAVAGGSVFGQDLSFAQICLFDDGDAVWDKAEGCY